MRTPASAARGAVVNAGRRVLLAGLVALASAGAAQGPPEDIGFLPLPVPGQPPPPGGPATLREERLRELQILESALSPWDRFYLSIVEGERFTSEAISILYPPPGGRIAQQVVEFLGYPDYILLAHNRDRSRWTMAVCTPGAAAIAELLESPPQGMWRRDNTTFLPRRYVHSGPRGDIALAVVPGSGLVLGAWGPGPSPERAVSRMAERIQSAPVRREGLGDEAYYQESLAARQQGAMAYWAMDAAEPVVTLARRSPRDGRLLGRLGFSAATLLDGELSLRDRLLRVAGRMTIDPREADLPALLGPDGPHPVLEKLPARCIGALGIRLRGIEPAWQAWRSLLLEEVYQGSQPALETALRDVDQSLGFSLERDLLPTLTGEAALGFVDVTPLGPTYVVALGVADVPLLDRLLREAATRRGGSHMDFGPDQGGLQVADWILRPATGASPATAMRVFYRFDGDVLLASEDEGAIRPELPRMEDDRGNRLNGPGSDEPAGPVLAIGDFQLLLAHAVALQRREGGRDPWAEWSRRNNRPHRPSTTARATLHNHGDELRFATWMDLTLDGTGRADLRELLRLGRLQQYLRPDEATLAGPPAPRLRPPAPPAAPGEDPAPRPPLAPWPSND